MFKHLDDDDCYRALAFCLTIISSLHDLLQYLCAFSRLGSSHARLGSRRVEFVSADWGGTEGIGGCYNVNIAKHSLDACVVDPFLHISGKDGGEIRFLILYQMLSCVLPSH